MTCTIRCFGFTLDHKKYPFVGQLIWILSVNIFLETTTGISDFWCQRGLHVHKDKCLLISDVSDVINGDSAKVLCSTLGGTNNLYGYELNFARDVLIADGIYWLHVFESIQEKDWDYSLISQCFAVVVTDNKAKKKMKNCWELTQYICSFPASPSSYQFYDYISVFKNTEQSSIYDNSEPSLAVDGMLNQVSGKCARTKEEFQPWWKIDLEFLVTIDHIVIHTSTDCCPENLTRFDVSVSKNNEDFTVCNNFDALFKVGEVVLVECSENGRFLLIQVKSKTLIRMTLCEVKVAINYDMRASVESDSDVLNFLISEYKTVTQSSNNGNTVAERALDGNTNIYNNSTCTKTANKGENWWKIEFKTGMLINHVIIFPASYTDRLRMINILVFRIGEFNKLKSYVCAKFLTETYTNHIKLFCMATKVVKLQIVRLDSKPLELCEVQIYGRHATGEITFNFWNLVTLEFLVIFTGTTLIILGLILIFCRKNIQKKEYYDEKVTKRKRKALFTRLIEVFWLAKQRKIHREDVDLWTKKQQNKLKVEAMNFFTKKKKQPVRIKVEKQTADDGLGKHKHKIGKGVIKSKDENKIINKTIVKKTKAPKKNIKKKKTMMKKESVNTEVINNPLKSIIKAISNFFQSFINLFTKSSSEVPKDKNNTTPPLKHELDTVQVENEVNTEHELKK